MLNVYQSIKAERLMAWSVGVFLLFVYVGHSAAFVNSPIHPQVHVVSSSRFKGSKCTTGIGIGRTNWEGGEGGIFRREWSGEGLVGRRRGNYRGDRRSVAGVRSLSATLGMPPVTTADIVEFVGRALQEQSVKHHWQSGFIGGSVGVVGTLTAIKIKINQVRELTSCPYCRSSGHLACATCFGTGSVAINDVVSSSGEVSTTTLTCPRCRGQTYVTCVNCKGDGRGVPLFLNKKVSRDPESEIEEVGYA